MLGHEWVDKIHVFITTGYTQLLVLAGLFLKLLKLVFGFSKKYYIQV
jgi:hypothetical protein